MISREDAKGAKERKAEIEKTSADISARYYKDLAGLRPVSRSQGPASCGDSACISGLNHRSQKAQDITEPVHGGTAARNGLEPGPPHKRRAEINGKPPEKPAVSFSLHSKQWASCFSPLFIGAPIASRAVFDEEFYFIVEPLSPKHHRASSRSGAA